jgi:hypothetical protein
MSIDEFTGLVEDFPMIVPSKLRDVLVVDVLQHFFEGSPYAKYSKWIIMVANNPYQRE